MALSIDTLKRASKLAFYDPEGFWYNLKRHFLKAKSGPMQINGISFRLDLELDPYMRLIYFGTYQREITNLCKRFIKKGDTFIDVGANIGYLSAFVLGLVGEEGQVHAFEPVPRCFKRLQQIKTDNPAYNIYANGVAVGEKEGVAKIAVTNLQNIGWNTLVPDFMPSDTIRENIEVEVVSLDRYLLSRNIKNVRLVKIDTEGYEFPVIKGLQEFLRRSETLPVLIVEISPTAYPKLNTSIDELSRLMSGLGYVASSIDLAHEVQLDKLGKITDVVFVPRKI